jgi:hypothetical protein
VEGEDFATKFKTSPPTCFLTVDSLFVFGQVWRVGSGFMMLIQVFAISEETFKDWWTEEIHSQRVQGGKSMASLAM